MNLWSLRVLRFGLAIVFFYFGVLAIRDPGTQLTIWMPVSLQAPIRHIVDPRVPIFTFGIVEVVIAASLLSGVMLEVSSLASAIVLVPIIVSLWPSDSAIRDITILCAALALFLATKMRAVRAKKSLERG